jgi:hypothetical protein
MQFSMDSIFSTDSTIDLLESRVWDDDLFCLIVVVGSWPFTPVIVVAGNNDWLVFVLHVTLSLLPTGSRNQMQLSR